MKKLSVVVPVYYNEQSLALLFESLVQVERELLEIELALELIFVDDGSGDNSLVELKKIKAQRPSTKIVKLTRNFGSYNAIKAGFSFVSGNCFMFLAADLQDPPKLIVSLAKKWLSGHKYVVAARSERHDPLLSRVFSSLYYKIVRKCVLKTYPEKGFDSALMDESLLPHILKVGKHVNLTLFAHWLGFKPEIVNYVREERQHGKSRWTFLKKLKLFFDSIFGFSFIIVRFIMVLSLLVSLCSFSYGVFILTHALVSHSQVPGFAATITLISFLMGLSILMLGIIGEIAWRIFDQVNSNPGAVIDEVL